MELQQQLLQSQHQQLHQQLQLSLRQSLSPTQLMQMELSSHPQPPQHDQSMINFNELPLEKVKITKAASNCIFADLMWSNFE
jgi:hypothetical protein